MIWYGILDNLRNFVKSSVSKDVFKKTMESYVVSFYIEVFLQNKFQIF